MIRAIKLAAGSVLVVGLFFLAGYGVDFFARRKSAVSPAQHFLKPAAPASKSVPRQPAAGKQPPAPSMSFFDTLLQKDKKPAQRDTVREKALLSIQRRRKKPVESTAETRAVPVPPGRKADAPGPTYKIQLGSFKSASSAGVLAGRMKKLGYMPYIATVSLAGGQRMYRVRIGKFRREEDARKLAREIESKENISVLVTTR